MWIEVVWLCAYKLRRTIPRVVVVQVLDTEELVVRDWDPPDGGERLRRRGARCFSSSFARDPSFGFSPLVSSATQGTCLGLG